MRKKDEVLQKFKKNIRYVEKQAGRKFKYLQTGSGREYYNNQFDDFLRSEGIQKRLTVPYTPEQNAVAERKKRTSI